MKFRTFQGFVALSLFIGGFLYLLFSLAVSFLSYGLPPCQSEDSVFWSRFALSFAFFVGGAIIFRPLSISAKKRTVLAVALPILAFAMQTYVASDNEKRQAACAERTLAQAMDFCGAKQSHWRKGTDERSFDTLTLVPPGGTDQAWWCLQRWSDHSEKAPAMLIDESVYAQAQERYRQRCSNANAQTQSFSKCLDPNASRHPAPSPQ